MESFILKQHGNHVLYYIPIDVLIKICENITSFQRQIDEDHVEEIIEYYKTNHMLCGALSLCFLNEKYYIVDGQHRFVAMRRIKDEEPDYSFFCHVYTCKTEEDMFKLFSQINSCKPLELASSRVEAETIRHVSEYFKTRFSKYCKYYKSGKEACPRQPNINMDRLIDELNNSGILKIRTEELLEYEIDKLNEFYKTTKYEKWIEWGVTSTALERSNNEFFLGLFGEFEWISHLMRSFNEKIAFSDFEHRSVKNSEKITKALRDTLWRKFFDSVDGKCACCNKTITFSDYEAGHVISRVKGGETNIKNLRPVCGECNKDMGIKNMNEYILKIQEQLK
jgi:hypothetical protein